MEGSLVQIWGRCATEDLVAATKRMSKSASLARPAFLVYVSSSTSPSQKQVVVCCSATPRLLVTAALVKCVSPSRNSAWLPRKAWRTGLEWSSGAVFVQCGKSSLVVR